ncbi:hypothetical protein [Undibacterium sp.]|jgi:hypothetical protein|uniref:hypothetical protein n=1 Tax=Undibacterium sp. TaxID=1914977 RepID=UPI002CAD5E1D|nr:hypothetical protein [Undibacterium sp.]HTD05163.1 hypothetical protein [Undibacterium sp.]
MMSTLTNTHVTHWGLRVLAAGLLLGLVACATPQQQAAATMPIPQLAADWHQHSRPLFNHGPGLSPGTNSWWVPAILPRGTYEVIGRVDGKLELIDGYRFEIDSDFMKEIRLMIPSGYTDVEALEEKYIVNPKRVHR